MSKIKFQLKNDEYDYNNGKNVLPISDIPLNLIPKGPPKTGEIYLRLVHEEAKNCPKVVRKELPVSEEKVITKETKNVNYLRKYFNKFEEETEKVKKSNQLIPSYLKASKEWKVTFIKEFKKSRNIFSKYSLPDHCIKELFPALEDESNWKVYLYGKSKRGLKKENSKLLHKVEESNELVNLTSNDIQKDKKRKLIENGEIDSNNKRLCTNSNSSEDTTYEDNINNMEDIKINKIKVEGRDPLLVIIKQMNQKIINKIIYYHSLWIKTSFSQKQFQWIYALLIGLDPLLTSSQVSILRDICKLCKIHREQLYKDAIENNNEEVNNTELDNNIKNNLIKKVAPLNIIITIITVFYSQSDLE